MNGLSAGTIIAAVYLVVIIVIVIIIWAAVHKIRRKIKEYSRSLFGVEDFVKGYQHQAEHVNQRPRSLNGMTDICLPNITSDFPEFNYNEVKSKSETLIKAYLNSLEAENISALKDPQYSPDLKARTMNIINDLQSRDMHIFYDNIVIHDTVISDYLKGNGLCTVKLQSSVGYINYVKDGAGNIIKGSQSAQTETVYVTEYTYIQDITKLKESGMHNSISLSCPNCGAPITNLGESKFCEYCGTGIKEINIKSWKFTNIDEHGIRGKKYF